MAQKQKSWAGNYKEIVQKLLFTQKKRMGGGWEWVKGESTEMKTNR